MTFTILWVVWLLFFAVVETWALIRKKRNDTLSEHAWDWFCLRGPKAGRDGWCMTRRIAFFAFWLWLTVHFLTGGAWM